MGQAGTRDHGLLGGHIGGLVLQGRRVLVDGCLLRGGLDQAQRDLRGVGRRIVEDLDLHALGFRRPHQHQVAADTVDVGDRIEGDGNLLVIGAAGTGEDQIELLESGVGSDGGEMGRRHDTQVDVGDVARTRRLAVDIARDVSDVAREVDDPIDRMGRGDISARRVPDATRGARIARLNLFI